LPEGVTIGSAINNYKIFVFSNKILVQDEDEVYETTHLEINGSINEVEIYGNNIRFEHVYRGADLIIGKSVIIEVNGSINDVTPTKTEYVFSEEFKKLKPIDIIAGIAGAINRIEVKFYK